MITRPNWKRGHSHFIESDLTHGWIQSMSNSAVGLTLTYSSKHHATVSIQLNIVTCRTYPEKFIPDNVVFTVFTIFRCHGHSAGLGTFFRRQLTCERCPKSRQFRANARMLSTGDGKINKRWLMEGCADEFVELWNCWCLIYDDVAAENRKQKNGRFCVTGDAAVRRVSVKEVIY